MFIKKDYYSLSYGFLIFRFLKDSVRPLSSHIVRNSDTYIFILTVLNLIR